MRASPSRPRLIDTLHCALERSPVVVLSGPRHCGKTTLARMPLPANHPNDFDLEDPRARALLAELMVTLEPLTGLVVIDEIQRVPELFPMLRVLVDRRPLPARFLILGSASGDLLRQSSESLAGRVTTLRMGGLSLEEVGAASLEPRWLRGGFPDSFLAPTDEDSTAWRCDFIDTLLERDLPQ